jgi:hypothetical protein
MSTCPKCNLPNSWLSSQCQCPQDTMDKILQIFGTFDYITPIEEIRQESRGREQRHEDEKPWWRWW